ncbi:MAG: Rieske (2Fe-2S) protein [Chloroflexi bacterium]|nr:Rieske (2Fe-2S) protein [Chloroflexota bacterium]
MTNSLQDLPALPITRRKFIQTLLGFSIVSTLAGIFIPIVAYLLPTKAQADAGGPTDVGALADFPVGTGTVVSVNDTPVIIVNTKAGGLKALSAICTHLGCIVAWNDKKNVVESPCHDGLFNPVTGAVVSGPPPRGLPLYELAVKEGRVVIGKPLGQIYGS